MSEQPTTNENKKPVMNWQTRSYMLWTAAGALFGVLSGYMYTRAAKEHADRNGDQPPPPATMELMGLVLAALAMVRQVAELGKPNEDRRKK